MCPAGHARDREHSTQAVVEHVSAERRVGAQRRPRPGAQWRQPRDRCLPSLGGRCTTERAGSASSGRRGPLLSWVLGLYYTSPADDQPATGSNRGRVVGKECDYGPEVLLTHHASRTCWSRSLARRADRGPTRVVNGLGDGRQRRYLARNTLHHAGYRAVLPRCWSTALSSSAATIADDPPVEDAWCAWYPRRSRTSPPRPRPAWGLR